MISTRWKGEKGEAENGSRMGGEAAGGWFTGFIVHLPLGTMKAISYRAV
jgi:hypothetical protein